MIKIRLFIPIIIIASLLSGCKAPLYMPTGINAPMLNNKGQYSASASF